jgi:hypothetical protein
MKKKKKIKDMNIEEKREYWRKTRAKRLKAEYMKKYHARRALEAKKAETCSGAFQTLSVEVLRDQIAKHELAIETLNKGIEAFNAINKALSEVS